MYGGQAIKKGVTKDQLVEFGKQKQKDIRPDVVEFLEFLKAKNVKAIVITAAPDVVAREICSPLIKKELLKKEMIYSSDTVFEDNKLKKINLLIGNEKFEIIKLFSKLERSSPKEVCHIGDGLADFLALKECGLGIGMLTNPNRGTQRLIKAFTKVHFKTWKEILKYFSEHLEFFE